MKQPDILIVGGGSAGCVLAARLSENPSRTVLLLEAGPNYSPDGFPQPLIDANVSGGDAQHDWGTFSQPGPIHLRRGRVLGGSSATNAGVAIRARQNDFDRWARRGLSGWSFPGAQDTFQSLPFPIRVPEIESLTPACRGFTESAMAAGLKYVSDFNGSEQHGVGPQPRNVIKGIRQNVAMAYLNDAVRQRPNLTILGNTEVDRVVFDGIHAVGVCLLDSSLLRAGETILSSGVYGTPGILMRSGIGPRRHLQSLDIPTVADLSVGHRLMDHPFVYSVYALSPIARQTKPAVGALVWTRSSEAAQGELDLQIIATHLFDHTQSPTGAALVIAVALTLPDSIGSFELPSRDPYEFPRIDPNFLAAPRDRRRLGEGIDLARTIARTPPLSDLIESEITAGTDIWSTLRSYHHATSTAPMGSDDDSSAVVNEDGIVRCVRGLRAVDASILPEIPSAPTNLTVIMAAEHIAKRMTSPHASPG